MTNARQPLYHRLLRLRYVKPRPMATFLFFEGSIMLAILLSLAEIVTWWSVVLVPVTVGVMVKLNDAIAGALRRPEAIAQLQRAPMANRVAIGRSRGPRTVHPTTWINPDDAVPGSPAGPGPARRPGAAASDGVFRGIAAVPSRDGEPAARDGVPLRRPDHGNQGQFAS
jgi:hypothetical protein